MKKNKPLVIKKLPVPFDCDFTLIEYDIEQKPKEDLIQVGLIPGKEIYVYPIKKHIQVLKNMKASNFFIIVWSGSGREWAEHLVKKLQLNEYVDCIMDKPRFYIDDEDANNWMKRLYYYKGK